MAPPEPPSSCPSSFALATPLLHTSRGVRTRDLGILSHRLPSVHPWTAVHRVQPRFSLLVIPRATLVPLLSDCQTSVPFQAKRRNSRPGPPFRHASPLIPPPTPNVGTAPNRGQYSFATPHASPVPASPGYRCTQSGHASIAAQNPRSCQTQDARRGMRPADTRDSKGSDTTVLLSTADGADTRARGHSNPRALHTIGRRFRWSFPGESRANHHVRYDLASASPCHGGTREQGECLPGSKT